MHVEFCLPVVHRQVAKQQHGMVAPLRNQSHQVVVMNTDLVEAGAEGNAEGRRRTGLGRGTKRSFAQNAAGVVHDPVGVFGVGGQAGQSYAGGNTRLGDINGKFFFIAFAVCNLDCQCFHMDGAEPDRDAAVRYIAQHRSADQLPAGLAGDFDNRRIVDCGGGSTGKDFTSRKVESPFCIRQAAIAVHKQSVNLLAAFMRLSQGNNMLTRHRRFKSAANRCRQPAGNQEGK
ncbi:MAG: hypothetical protein LC725_01270 [Lentisphaerae bacterium]|nr:hypothetical protein [Lentisphaerota bacterium]